MIVQTYFELRTLISWKLTWWPPIFFTLVSLSFENETTGSFKRISTKRIFYNGSLLIMKNSFRWSFYNFTSCLLSMRGKHPNNKNIGSPGLFSCKSLREFNNLHARYRVVQNLDFIWLAFTHAPFWLLLTYAPKYTRITRELIVGVFSKSASQVFTSQTMSRI